VGAVPAPSPLAASHSSPLAVYQIFTIANPAAIVQDQLADFLGEWNIS
jgi:hypothetical protein